MGNLFKFVISILLFAQVTRADGFLVDEQRAYGRDIFDRHSIGIEVEFTGLSDNQILDIVTQHFPLSSSTGSIEQGIFIHTHLGKIRFYVEGQSWRYVGRDESKFNEQLARDLKSAPRELAFPPVHYSDLITIHTLLTDLKFYGARGTTLSSAVSLQVNIQMPRLTSRHVTENLLNLLRVYHHPLHRKQIDAVLQVPEVRRPYVGDYSPGFMQRLLNSNYKPTPRELYDDFMYRQSLEIQNDPEAWTAPIQILKERLIAKGIDAIVPAVVKMNKVRISSLLMDAYPDDPLSQLAVKYAWAKPMPIIEFREFNNDFDVYSKVEMAVGLVESTRALGYYVRDQQNAPAYILSRPNLCRELLLSNPSLL